MLEKEINSLNFFKAERLQTSLDQRFPARGTYLHHNQEWWMYGVRTVTTDVSTIFYNIMGNIYIMS